MIPFSDWFPPLASGLLFTGLGAVKVYGRCRGVEGGGGKPWRQRACGSCPTWGRKINIGFVFLCLALGLGNLFWFGMVLMRAHS